MNQIESSDNPKPTTSKRTKLKSKKILVPAIATVAVLGVGGGFAAHAVASDGNSKVSGPDLDRASKAALAKVGGGKVTDVERGDGDDIEAYEVEVTRPNGSEVDVKLDKSFRAISATADDRDDSDDGNDHRGEKSDRDGDDRPVSKADQAKASAAALKSVPGNVLDVDSSNARIGSKTAAYEVEVRAKGGVEWNVHLDSNFGVVGTERDN
ncbi:PepSY domain-containing protein [Demetria terragena]|uniref:PepSY domain-containing protein n=1 Tax=Demetria terragena TaxID=63959 RepID=UPI00037D1708|nr:PepSY domain-containing protein [Demetria terragena]